MCIYRCINFCHYRLVRKTHPSTEGAGRSAAMTVLVPVELGLPYHDYYEKVGTYVLYVLYI